MLAPFYLAASKPLTSNHGHTIPICYNGLIESAQFLRLPAAVLAIADSGPVGKEGALRTMCVICIPVVVPGPARQVVLLTSSESFHPTQLLFRQQSTPVSPLTATLMDFPASVANKRLTAGLSPSDATLTKNRGVGAFMVNQLPLVPTSRRSNVPTLLQTSLFAIASTLFHFPYPVTPLLATLTKITGCVPTIPILGLNALRFTSTSVSTFRRADVQTFRRTNCPSVPNRTVQDPLPYAYNVWAIPTSPCPGDRPFSLSWRSS